MSLGRPRDGKTIKKVVSIRLEEKAKEKLIKKYGSIQKWVEVKLKEEGIK